VARCEGYALGSGLNTTPNSNGAFGDQLRFVCYGRSQPGTTYPTADAHLELNSVTRHRESLRWLPRFTVAEAMPFGSASCLGAWSNWADRLVGDVGRPLRGVGTPLLSSTEGKTGAVSTNAPTEVVMVINVGTLIRKTFQARLAYGRGRSD
jgi:hypothetical protein